MFYFKVKIPKILRPAKEFSAFNVALEEIFSVNLARRLEKLPTPVLKDLQLLNTWLIIMIVAEIILMNSMRYYNDVLIYLIW